MSILNREQRAVIQASTMIDPLIVDRIVESYDALLKDDVVEYRRLQLDALAQQNLPVPTPAEERPTAIDKMKTICLHAISDQNRWDFKRTAAYLEQLASP